jgi:hypothetical protein
VTPDLDRCGLAVGFSGSRIPPTVRGRDWLEATLSRLRLAQFSHGDCVGADQAAHQITRALFPEAFFNIRPGQGNGANRANCFPEGPGVIHKPVDNLVRDRLIVSESDVLVALPMRAYNIRSGTWFTIRYALGQRVPVVVPEWMTYELANAQRAVFWTSQATGR